MTAGTCGPHSTWSSPLAAALERFLEGKRAAGYRYRAEAQALGALDRVLSESLSPTDPVITSAIVRAFVARRGTESETTRAHRLTLIREVCRFLALDDPRTFVPAARFLGIHRRTSVPRVLSLDEGRRFLDACNTLARRRSSPRRDLVLRTLLVLLYLTGLRAGEALRLTLADVDLETAVLRIRDTKFGKSRLVPLAADVAARLAHCRDALTDELGKRTPGEPFFPAPSGQPYSLSALRNAFHAVLAAAGIPRWQGKRSLRLHDLAPDPGCPFDLPQRPAEASQRQDLLSFVFCQDVAHAGQELAVPDRCQRLGPLSLMAGFQVSTNGRIWVSTEGQVDARAFQ